MFFQRMSYQATEGGPYGSRHNPANACPEGLMELPLAFFLSFFAHYVKII
jgi:hypothetical protein